jgi:hypothetical protein
MNLTSLSCIFPFLHSVGAYSDVNLATKVAHDDTK